MKFIGEFDTINYLSVFVSVCWFFVVFNICPIFFLLIFFTVLSLILINIFMKKNLTKNKENIFSGIIRKKEKINQRYF